MTLFLSLGVQQSVSSVQSHCLPEETCFQKVCPKHYPSTPTPPLFSDEHLNVSYTLEITDQGLRTGADIKWLFLSLFHSHVNLSKVTTLEPL
jgi:hypothetical protein